MHPTSSPIVRPGFGRVCVVSGLLAATLVSALAAPTPFNLNPDRVSVSAFGGNLAASKTFVIPAVTLLISAHGSVWSMARNGDANAQVHAKFYVKGLDKPVVQDLARQIQDDLVTKLREAGYTVLTYAEIKDNATVAAHGRRSIDDKWNLPTMTQGDHSLSYVVGTPTDAQAFDRPINGPAWWMRDVAREKAAIVLVPEITFNVPIVYGEESKGYKRAEAAVKIEPTMKLMGATVFTSNGKGDSVTIQVLEHGKRPAAEVAGTLKKLSEDTTNFSSSWGRNSSDYLFTLDPVAFSDGVLRVGFAINTMIVSQIQKAKK